MIIYTLSYNLTMVYFTLSYNLTMVYFTLTYNLTMVTYILKSFHSVYKILLLYVNIVLEMYNNHLRVWNRVQDLDYEDGGGNLESIPHPSGVVGVPPLCMHS
jgi:hypothetical protein